MPEQAQPSKRALRAELRERRRIMTTSEQTSAAAGLLANLVRVVDQYAAGNIACYLSTGDEPPTREFLEWAHSQSIRVILPVAREDGLMDWAPYDKENEGLDAIGMPAPLGEVLAPIALADVDLIFVPAAAVAQDGMRLGWGRGYYDRALGSLNRAAPIYAVVYDHEVMDDVPRENHDQLVHAVVTPERIIGLGPDFI